MKSLLLVFASLSLVSAFADDSESLSPVEVNIPKEQEEVHAPEISPVKVSSDTASLLNMSPGVSLKTAGGVSSLPVIHGLADDRINIKIDGASITSACSNHMNPALSYIDPSKVDTIFVLPGITPVSHGGDSIGGSIVVKTKEITFKNQRKLKFRSFFKSNNENAGASLNYEFATDKYFAEYAGLDERANNYRNGKGERLKATLYNQNNQSLRVGKKLDTGAVSLKFTRSNIPYQGFVNQFMDLQDNVSNQLNLNYKGSIGEALIDSSVYYQHTNHLMNMISSERTGDMPMYTRSDEFGYNVKASFELSSSHVLTVGSEFNRYHLDDWWSGLPGVTDMMGPGTFQSINHGKRDRFALYAESERDWSNSVKTNFGLRTDIVMMDTGNVRGYNNTDNLPADAAAFNSRSHDKTDHNYDATALTKIKTSSMTDVEIGLGKKTRSPNLYERYAWAGTVTDPTNGTMEGMSAGMDMLMINWFGDGNGYVGDINLRPEVAHKISASFIAHAENNKDWEVRLSPFYSDIKNFIDADFIGTSMGGSQFLKFANHDAVIFGADLSAKAKVSSDFSVQTVAGYTRGYRKDGKADLYHLMPLNGKVALVYAKGKWTSDIVTHLVAKKKQVNEMRGEPETDGYALVDIGTSYTFSKSVKLDLGISNIFDLNYKLPLGGVDIVNYSRSSNRAVSGMGRSFNTALTIEL